MGRRRAFGQLLLWRLAEFRREPEVIFWVFVFPLLLAIGLGIAFRDRAPEKLPVAVLEGAGAAEMAAALAAAPQVACEIMDEARAARALRLGKVVLLAAPGDPIRYRFDPARPESVLARAAVDAALQRAAGRQDPAATRDDAISEPGGRYIDFLIPGLLGMNLMGGGMWGVGYMIVEMRIRKLLKRLMATPMRRTDFLLAIVASRLIFMLAETAVLLVCGRWLFGVEIQGSAAGIVFVGLLGSLCFSGLGLLTASRARKIETISGLINFVMLPMYVLSGVFFSAERFPAAFQPYIQALPLTALNDALRAVILEGATLASQWGELCIMGAWGGVAFALALRWFRWS
ncbi:MAG TPA: ABC transporter permease [Planctomycetes bacterium]|nr:ABC transporter permease [Planctomycetota bacterium]